MLDGGLDFLDRNAIGFTHFTAELTDLGEELLRNGGGTVHDEVRIRETGVNFLHAVNRQNFARGLTGELISAVARADRDCECIKLGLADKVDRLIRVGEQLITGQRAFRALTVFFFARQSFERTDAAEFAFNRHTDAVGRFHDAAGGFNVVLVSGHRLAIRHQGTVHHHGSEAVTHGADAGGLAAAVIKMHGDRNVRIGFNRGADEVFEEEFPRVLAGTSRGLKDNRGTGFLGSFHDGLNLLEVIDVKRRNTVAVLGRVVEKLAHCNKSHLLRLRKMVFWGRYRLKGGDILTKDKGGCLSYPQP